MAVVTPTDRPKSVRNRCVIELFSGVVGVILNKNSFISQNNRSITETRVIGTENNLCKFELGPIIFLDSKGIWNLKYKEIRGSGAKLFLRENGRDLTQSYDKSPCTNRNVQRAKWQHKQHNATKSSSTQRLRTDLGRSVGVTTATQLVWLTWFTGPTFPFPATAV